MMISRNFRLCDIELDEAVGTAGSIVEQETAVAILDLLDDNLFQPRYHHGGPYRLKLLLVSSKLEFLVRTEDGATVARHILSLTPIRRIVKDYSLICETHYRALRGQPASQIEAIDMGRRALHNEGSRILMDRLSDKIRMDLNTARRLFTLICVLLWRCRNG
jgi:uncharacterized protein (UPF0262 family)